MRLTCASTVPCVITLGESEVYNSHMPMVDSAGVPIHYEVAGQGPPVVLVHGFMSSMDSWVRTGWVEFLMARGRSAVRLDVRGHGGSGKPHDPTAYENPRMPGDVLAVMMHWGSRALT
jgi:pimeloyl-ACP methyl ester carboxylesterase